MLLDTKNGKVCDYVHFYNYDRDMTLYGLSP